MYVLIYMYKIDSLPNDLVRKIDHVVHFRSYINSRVTPSEKVVVVMVPRSQLSTCSNSELYTIALCLAKAESVDHQDTLSPIIRGK